MTRSAGLRVLCEDPSCMRAATHQVAITVDNPDLPNLLASCCEAHAQEAEGDPDYSKALYRIVLVRVQAERGDPDALYRVIEADLDEQARAQLARFRVALEELDRG